ncbi:ABC transporter ATP-binding protein [Deinococcus yavapaiensis]|uniref:Peptide/nickel transport system ATP-binding protein n=1 Tax=Deinococcus yavapaiensis KR-236 TaxID=694435 RepID=A0A318S5M8_9DEIO|nr:ABC transporter ATP-binding protein [Deinococcus yavapaiensis]PYE53865.1 peptide/nickel transport system ATP-binding protein [Deinococcus yavapaiensis KR-236]
MTASSSVLTVRDLNVTYRGARGPVHAVSDASFDLHVDECIALIGESGSGKSTLGQSLARLLPVKTTAITGQVTYHGRRGPENVLTFTAPDLRAFRWRECAYVTQSAISAFNPLLRISEHFEETARAHGAFGRGSRTAAFELLESVRLEPTRVWNAYPHELSGGMRQRVLLALALLLEPKILILDEPTTALDVLTQRAIIDVLTSVRRRKKLGIIFISHDLGVASELADRLFTMYAGRIVETGTTEQVLRRTAHPYTASLLRAIPSLETQRDVTSIPGSPPNLVTLPTGCPFHPRCVHARPQCTRGHAPPLDLVDAGHGSACHFAGNVQAQTVRERKQHV